MKRAIIDNKVKHQGIGGQEIIIEKELTINDILDEDSRGITIALFNFIKRRIDLMDENYGNKKVYYGHVGNLGYYVSEDEIKEVLK